MTILSPSRFLFIRQRDLILNWYFLRALYLSGGNSETKNSQHHLPSVNMVVKFVAGKKTKLLTLVKMAAVGFAVGGAHA